MDIYDALQIREIFHLEFLRWMVQKIKPENYILKGGVNLRFFFKSFRYSEDMDLDARGIGVKALKETVIKILESPSFQNSMASFGVKKVVMSDMGRAKQTETTQRFKVHLITSSGEDLFTKVEFSRRGFQKGAVVESIPEIILRAYKMSPVIVSHYGIEQAVLQKVAALAMRVAIQARDIFDLYVLSPQYSDSILKERGKQTAGLIDKNKFKKAHENIFEVGFQQFRDTVISYLREEDQAAYGSAALWDEIRLKAAHFVDEVKKSYA